MPRSRRLLWLAAPLLVLLLVAAAGLLGYRAGDRDDAGTTTTPSAGPDGTLPADTTDIGFAQDMLDHHNQAVQIANFAEAHADSPMVRSMAAAVIASQRYEIGLFEQFLNDRGATRGDPDRTVMGWMGMPVPHDQMNGLQPTPVIVEYLNLSGPALDRRFLELMIGHHEGGVHMAEYAADHAANHGLRELASRMVVEQQREIGDYRSALQAVQ